MQAAVVRSAAELEVAAAAVQPANERRNLANSGHRELTQAKVRLLAAVPAEAPKVPSMNQR